MSHGKKKTYPSRGTRTNPKNRFENREYFPDPDASAAEGTGPRTQFFLDSSRSILSSNTSPDIPFTHSLNPYRGCEHGCSYCYARPYHEYLGFSAGLDFETKILVKKNAASLLRAELGHPRWKPTWLALSGVTDPYQPVEKHLGITRECLEVLLDFRNPVGIVTKNFLVTRDLDLLRELASFQACYVNVSITTLDAELARRMEPRTATPERRLEAIQILAEGGIPVGVFASPVIPGLNDHEIPEILARAAAAGARTANFIPLRLPHGLDQLFSAWLEENYPDRRSKVLHRLREIRGGKLNQSGFGERMRGQGIFADQTRDLFQLACRRHGLNENKISLSTAHFRRPGPQQGSLFGKE